MCKRIGTNDECMIVLKDLFFPGFVMDAQIFYQYFLQVFYHLQKSEEKNNYIHILMQKTYFKTFLFRKITKYSNVVIWVLKMKSSNVLNRQ